MAQEMQYDLIILDIMLPILDGWSILKKVRSKDKTIPILLLTARDSVDDRVKGLNEGADDYLVKPFVFSELLARIQALLRRGKKPQENCIKIRDLEIDLLKRKVRRGKKRVDLSPKEFNLLSLLARHLGQTLSRTFISEQVWDMNFDSDSNIVDVSIKRLRAKIGDSGGQKLIRTVRGSGYVIED